MEHLRSMLLEEIDSFRELGHKFKNKEISSAEFKSYFWGNGSICTSWWRRVYDKT